MKSDTCVRCSGINDNDDGMCKSCSTECICPECGEWVAIEDMRHGFMICVDCYAKVEEVTE